MSTSGSDAVWCQSRCHPHPKFPVKNRIRWILALGGVAALLAPAPLFAQVGGDDPAATARVHLGPLSFTPRVAIKNLGVDSNVFNAAESPERDFTAAFVPGVDAWLRMRRAVLSSKTSVEWVYFRQATKQRSLNVAEDARLDLFLARLNPHVGGRYDRTRQRPNLEVDQRVRQKTTEASAGVGLLIGSRFRVDLDGRQTTVDYNDGEYGDAFLADALNRTSTVAQVSARFGLTPLTTFVLRAASTRDRFELSPLRNSDSISVVPGFEFKPFAIISGSAFVGMRRFNALDSGVRDFNGLVSAVNVNYVAREVLKFTVRVDRDIDYSYRTDKPYFVSSGGSLEVTRAIGLYWDVVGRAGLNRLVYRAADTPGVLGGDERDRVTSRGVGIGRKVGENLRIGFDVDYVSRRSDVKGRNYDGFRIGASFIYGS
jgi:Putative beta-barrel porin 2